MQFGNHLSRSEYTGLAALAIILTLFTIDFWWITNCPNHRDSSTTVADSTDEVHLFWDSIKKQQNKYKHILGKRIKPFRFNPNTADSATFVRLGLPYWIAGRIIHYRKAGGIFKKVSDLKKIYGLSVSDFRILLPYISIAPNRSNNLEEIADSTPAFKTFQATKYTKFQQPIHLDLNATDSVTLLKIPGIGSYYAHRILHYGQLLGGYVNTSQLLEIKGISEEIVKWFYTNKSNVSKLHINKLSFRDLLRHPYLNYEQVKVIFQYREKYGPLNTIKELRNYEVFSPQEKKRLDLYLSID